MGPVESVRNRASWIEGETCGAPKCGDRSDPTRFADPAYDHDCCGFTTVYDPVLFAQQTGDATAISSKDVAQRFVGNCYFLASLAAMASSESGRKQIESMIRPNMGPDGKLETCEVTLHVPVRGVVPPEYRPTKVTVDARSFPDGGTMDRRSADGKREIWPLVLEKALARVAGGYQAIGHGGWPHDFLPMLTGKPAVAVPSGQYSVDALRRDLAAGRPVVFSTNPTAPKQNLYGLHGPHAYSVAGVQEEKGQRYVLLRNPWGDSHPTRIPERDWANVFSLVSVGGR